MSLDKPLAILEKGKDDTDGTKYCVKSIVKRKILFKIRPKPIVGN